MTIKRFNPKVFDIDKNNLPEECERHISLYMEVAEYAAEAKKEFDLAELDFELVEAELDRAIRLHPQKYGLPEKLTEKMIENTIKIQPSYKVAYIKLIEAKHEKDVQTAAVSACEQRKSNLNDLVSLLIGSFYGEPKQKSEHKQLLKEEKDRNRRGERMEG